MKEGGGYLPQLQQFKEDVEDFYDVGGRTFLVKDGNPNESTETFYMHVLRYYIPEIALETYQKHQTGVGVYNMQGFERRNKESKDCLKKYSNKKGNYCINNIKRCYDFFNLY